MIRQVFFGAIALVTLGTASAGAVTISAGSLSTVASGGIAPGSNTDTYFFGPSPAVSAAEDLTDFTLGGVASIFNGGSGYGYATIQAPGGSSVFSTGVAYVGSSGTSNLATFTLNSGSDVSFTMYVEYGNTDANALDDSFIAVTANGSQTVTTSVTDSAHVNDFVSFLVTDANAGDSFTISSNGPRPYIGGVTFSLGGVTDVPEPASFALLGAGAAALGCLRRRGMSR